MTEPSVLEFTPSAAQHQSREADPPPHPVSDMPPYGIWAGGLHARCGAVLVAVRSRLDIGSNARGFSRVIFAAFEEGEPSRQPAPMGHGWRCEAARFVLLRAINQGGRKALGIK